MRAWAVALLILAGSAVVALGASQSAANHSSSTIGLLAIDALPQDNTATSLERIDGCAASSVGGLVIVDYVVNAVPIDRPLIGFEAEIRYDSRLLQVVDVESDFLIAAEGQYQPFDGLSDPLPDSDGKLRIVVLDIASETFPQANVESGPGVLSRVTFRARAKGISRISIGFDRAPDLLYPLVQDTQNETIGVDRLGSASIAIGRNCPKPRQNPRIREIPSVSTLTQIRR
jgi:hypothetical protein